MAVPAAYLDECVDPRLATKLAQRGFRVTTAVAEGTSGLSDEQQLVFALEHDLLLVSHDQPDFRRWHAVLQDEGRPHGGIALLPFGPAAQVELRIAMLLDWIGRETDHHSRLFRWHELQGWLTGGNRLPGYEQADFDLALGRRGS